MGRGLFFAFWLVTLGLPTSCTTVENDPTTNSPAALYRTRVDFHPPTREERDNQIAFEKKVLEKKLAEIEAKREDLEAQREAVYQDVATEFPECDQQKHCLSRLSKGNIQRFERYREARAPLSKIDADLGELNDQEKLWKYRHDLRVRAVYNRYLVRLILDTPKVEPRLKSVEVHSLEAFANREQLSRRLLTLTNPDMVPTLVGDLDFRMFQKAVDEAASLLTIRVIDEMGEQFLLTLLVNTHQLDPHAYESGFLKAWARRFIDQETLKAETFCGLYSVASATLEPKLGPGKARPCGLYRNRAQALTTKYEDRNRPEAWMLPLVYKKI